MLSSTYLIHFSPTFTTQKIARVLGENISTKVHEYDLSLKNITKHHFNKSDVVIFGVPVYGGRVPVVVPDYIENFAGTETKVITFVAYGGREYEDALLELNDLLTAKGFVVVASAAFIAQHSLVPKFAEGRPNFEDYNYVKKFAKLALDKITVVPMVDAEEPPEQVVTVKGNRPYKEHLPIAMTPFTNTECIKCYKCINSCPTEAIEQNNPEKTYPEKCILCARCIRICPANARFLPAPFLEKLTLYLTHTCKEEKQPEFFL